MRATQSIQRLWPVLMLSALAACSSTSTSNPITVVGGATGADVGDADSTDDNSGFNDDVTPPPGTANPTPGSSITRSEPTGGETGDGFVTTVSYTPPDGSGGGDTFTVDNLPFDGGGAYSRDNEVPGTNAIFPYAVYESAAQTLDPFNGQAVNQFQHKAIYFADGNSKFAIVRTGGYVDYGFGGFIYQRDGGVTLPTTGQASFTGDYMGLRDFDGIAGLEYTVAEMEINIDFEDFNDNGAVKGGLRNRQVYDTGGNLITQTVVDALNTENGTSLSELPVVIIDVTTGAITANGEMQGTVRSVVGTDAFETGNYYAVLSGTNATEVVGIVTFTADDPRFDSVTVRETGGFIISR